MKITNVRLGYATNSSSSHSLLLVTDAKPYTRLHQEYKDFGWDHWVAATPEAKMCWLWTCVRSCISGQLGPRNAEIVTRALLGDVIVDPDASIDHQSVITLPVYQDDRYALNAEFLHALTNAVLADNMVLEGGNDNEDEDAISVVSGTPVKWWSELPKDEGCVLVYAKHVADKQWLLFNTDSGARITIDFANTPSKGLRPSTPVLVDWKITDYCAFACKFCYQDSTSQGAQLSYESYKHQLGIIRNWSPFEVTLGGGEPTLSTRFDAIYYALSGSGIALSLTTRNYKWLHDLPDNKYLLEAFGALGVSVNKYDVELAEIIKKLSTCKDGPRITLHVIDGIVTLADLQQWRALTQVCNRVNMLLLGYKTTGRGMDFQSAYHGVWQQVYNISNNWDLRVDSLFAKQYAFELVGFEDVSLETREGFYSCYIDGPRGLLAPSSYQMEHAIKLTRASDWQKLQVA